MKNLTKTTNERIRTSNFELFRIILMFFIIAHHYVVNSGFIELYDFKNITANMIFLQIFGMFGKTIINCFTLITGFFMVNSHITIEKFLKVYLQIKFYILFFYIIFVVTGYEEISIKEFIKTVFSVIYDAGSSYSGTYLFLFLFIPFLNHFIKSISKKVYQKLLLLLIIYFTIFSTFFFHDTFDYLGWLMTVYLIGAYISLYPSKTLESMKIALLGSSISIFFMVASIIIIDFVGSKFGFYNYYHMMTDSNKFLALTCSVSLFLVFKNMQINLHKGINSIASLTFGILLFHANKPMRRFLWKTVFNNTNFYESKFLVIHAVSVCILVFCAGALFEYLRKICLEKPLFELLHKKNFFSN